MNTTPSEQREQLPLPSETPPVSTPGTNDTAARRRVVIGESEQVAEPVASPYVPPAMQPYAGPSSLTAAPGRISSRVVVGIAIALLVVALLIAAYPALTRGSSSGQNPSATGTAVSQPTSVGVSDVPGLPTPGPTNTPSVTETEAPPAAGLGTPMPDEGNQHVAEGTIIIYKNYPPSSGPHYPSTANPGFYEQPVPEGFFVHSMEHGYVVVYYNPNLPDATKKQLKDLMTMLPLNGSDKPKLIIVPYTNMPTPLAIAAWRRLLLIKEFNFDEIRTFYQEWVNKGPENVP